MENLKIDGQSITLVDQVEDKLLNYFRSQDLKVGDSIPNEIELSSALGVARSVLREALSRLKMMGMIESRTRRGMILTEPFILGGMKRVVDPRIMSQESLLDLLGFRVALEIGISSDIFHNIKEQDIMELEEIVNAGVALGNNEYANLSEYTFHSKLYEITGNKTIVQFQSIIHPVMNFVKTNLRERVEYNPARVDVINERLNVMYDLLHKHRLEKVEELIALKDELGKKLKGIQSFAEQIEILEKQIKSVETEMDSLAGKLHKARVASEEKLREEMRGWGSFLPKGGWYPMTRCCVCLH